MTHPASFIEPQLVDQLRRHALEAEHLQQLHPHQLQLIHEQGWLKMLVPKKYGGLAFSLPEVLKIEESLAYADGSVAWVVTLCAGAAWFAGYLDPLTAVEIFADSKTCFAGSGMTSGVAEEIPGGYILNGYWKYVSGALHATMFTANFIIHRNGRPILHKRGTPEVRAFVIKQENVTLHKTWHSMGMIATGTHAFEVKGVTVPPHRSFLIDANEVVIYDPVYRYPFLQLAETTLAVNLSGMAVRFLDLCDEILLYKKRGDTSIQKKKLDECRDRFYDAVESSWESCVHGGMIPERKLREVTDMSLTMARCAREVVDEIYPHCGLMAADTREEINRVWRNLHTASQHSLFLK